MSDLDLSDIVSNNYTIAVTRDEAIIKKAQKLRYKVFCEEIGAKPDNVTDLIDADAYDEHCDHLIVYDHTNNADDPEVIGNYRLLRFDAMKKIGRFYTESEFDVSCLYDLDRNLLELGRSCVHPEHRTGNVMQLLWKGLGRYIDYHKITLMFGCASFHGSDPEQHLAGLSYLHHFHLAPENMCPTPLPESAADIKLIPKDELDVKRSFASLPTLIKGYLRLGGCIGNGPALDFKCNTTDVCILVDRLTVSDRYVNKFSSSSESPITE